MLRVFVSQLLKDAVKPLILGRFTKFRSCELEGSCGVYLGPMLQDFSVPMLPIIEILKHCEGHLQLTRRQPRLLAKKLAEGIEIP